MEKCRKRKHTRAGKMSSKDKENFSRKSSTEIRDKPRFKKGLFHQGSQVHPRVDMIGILIPELRETMK